MTETLYLIPAAGRRVLDPATFQPLAQTGAEKPRTTYWLRRLRDGDVTIGTPAAVAEVQVPADTAARAGRRSKSEPER